MFNTPLADIKEIKDYCECNIPLGSIHSHKLFEVLKEGISRHVDYLGMSELSLGYTLLDSEGNAVTDTRGKDSVNNIVSSAPEALPVREEYPDSLSFLKAKIAYKIAVKQKQTVLFKGTPL